MAILGGKLAFLVFVHFAVDWIFQSHDEAMRKHNQWRPRARHCAVYTAPFAAILCWSVTRGMSPSWAAALTVLVFLSHFVEDTYVPVLLWAKYVRRPPCMRWRVREEHGMLSLVGPEFRRGGVLVDLPSDKDRSQRSAVIRGFNEVGRAVGPTREAQRAIDRLGFLEFVSDPLGKILMIAVDQIIHVGFLVPVALLVR